MKSILFVFFAIILSSCSHLKLGQNKIETITHFKLLNPPIVGKTDAGQEIFLGGFSGLSFKEINKEGEYIFKTITDRGPNGYNIEKDRPFLIPDFSPQIITFKTNKNNHSLEIIDTLKLKKKNGNPLTGLPNTRDDENPIDIFGFTYSIDPDGLDTEGIFQDEDNSYWVSDEYAPSLVHFNADGRLIRRLIPGFELPKIYSERKPNRGFEGIAKIDNLLFGFLQSPIRGEKDFSRIVEVDLNSMKTSAEYFYFFEEGNDKIGDAIAISKNQFLIIEQNGKKGERGSRLVYKITLQESDHAVKKELLINLNETPFLDKEKIEGLTIIDSQTIGLVCDNDFQIADKSDFKSGKSPLNNERSELLIIKFRNTIRN